MKFKATTDILEAKGVEWETYTVEDGLRIEVWNKDRPHRRAGALIPKGGTEKTYRHFAEYLLCRLGVA